MLTVAESAGGGTRCAEVEPMLFQPQPQSCERYASCSDACTCTAGTRCGAVEGVNDTLCIPGCESSDDCPVPGAFDPRTQRVTSRVHPPPSPPAR